MGSEISARRWPPWAERAESAASGSPDLTAVHAEHADFVWRSLQQLGAREPDLEDLLQEVFVVVHRRLATFDATAPIRPWLFGICKRVAAAHRRRAYVRRETLESAPDAGESDGLQGSPEADYEARQARARLDTLLGELDLEKRAVLVMFEIDGMSCEDIAGALGVPVGTVYSRLHSARKAFQKALARSNAREPGGGGA